MWVATLKEIAPGDLGVISPLRCDSNARGVNFFYLPPSLLLKINRWTSCNDPLHNTFARVGNSQPSRSCH